MPNKKIINRIKFIIDNHIKLDSGTEELSYLCLTSKSESHFRDKIAYELYKTFQDDYYVIREWKKCDLAILDKQNNLPVVLIEFKVCYSSDLCRKSNLNEYTDAINSDLKKSIQLGQNKADIYSIIFIVKPKELIPDHLKPIIKYYKLINASFNVNGSARNIEKIGRQNLKKHFPKIEFYDVRTNTAYGLKCGLEYGIVKSERN